MKGARKELTRKGATREGEITRGTHLMAVYPASFWMTLYVLNNWNIKSVTVCELH